MNLIIWKQSYSAGIEEMDQHHQKLMQLLNSLNEDLTLPLRLILQKYLMN